MLDVIARTHIRGNPLLGAFCCFAVAGLATTTVDATAVTVGAVALAIGGVYAAARYANSVSRKRLAVVSLVTWLAFIAITGLHVGGLTTVAAFLPVADGVVIHAITAITWALLFAAASTTTFLGFREYGRSTGTHSPEESVLDGETSDYSTR